MKIKLNTIKDVKDFAEISSTYHNSEIVIKQDRYRVDGKSILGIFSLNLLEPIKVIIDSESENDKNTFYSNIQRWKTDDA